LNGVLGSTPRSAPSSLPALHGPPPYKLTAPAAARQSVLKPLTMPPPAAGEQLLLLIHPFGPASVAQNNVTTLEQPKVA